MTEPSVFSFNEYERILVNLDTFKVPQLKAVAKGLSIAQTGRKADVNDRVKRFVQRLRETNEHAKLFAVRDLIADAARNKTDLSIENYKHKYEGVVNTRVGVKAPRKPWIFFKENPFFNMVKLVHPHAGYCHRAPTGRGTSTLSFSISEDYIHQLKNDPKKRLILMCGKYTSGADNTDGYVEFPAPLEINFNGVLVPDNVKGLKTKPGTAKPADLTPYIKNVSNQENLLEMVFAFTNVDYLYFCYIVHRNSPEDILHQILSNPHIPSDTTMAEFNPQEDDDEEEIREMSSVLSLKCPLSYTKMKYPSKTIFCKHLTCFDALSFVQLQEQIPTWDCPICHQKVNLKELVISDYVLDIINATDANVESVELEANGGWNPVVESDDDESDSEEENHDQSSAASGKKSTEPEVINLDSDSEEDDDQPLKVGEGSSHAADVVLVEDTGTETTHIPSDTLSVSLQSDSGKEDTIATTEELARINSYTASKNTSNGENSAQDSTSAQREHSNGDTDADTVTITTSTAPTNPNISNATNTAERRAMNPLLPHSDRYVNQPVPAPTLNSHPLHKPPPPKFPPVTSSINRAATSSITGATVSNSPLPPPPLVTGSSLITNSDPKTLSRTAATSEGSQMISSPSADNNSTHVSVVPAPLNGKETEKSGPPIDLAITDATMPGPDISSASKKDDSSAESPGSSKLTSLTANPQNHQQIQVTVAEAPTPLPIVTAPPPILSSNSSTIMTPMMREMAEMEKIPVVADTTTTTNKPRAPIPPPHLVTSSSKSSLLPVMAKPSSSSSTVRQFELLNPGLFDNPLSSNTSTAGETNDSRSIENIFLQPNSKSSLLASSNSSALNSPKNGREAQLTQVQNLTNNLQRSVSANYKVGQSGVSTITSSTLASVSPPLVMGASSIAAFPENNEINSTNHHQVTKDNSNSNSHNNNNNSNNNNNNNYNSNSNNSNKNDNMPVFPPHHHQGPDIQYKNGDGQSTVCQQPKYVAPPYSVNYQRHPNFFIPQQRTSHYNQNQIQSQYQNQSQNQNQNQGYLNNQQPHNRYQYHQVYNNNHNNYNGHHLYNNSQDSNPKRAFSGDSSLQHMAKKPAPVVIDLTLDSDEDE